MKLNTGLILFCLLFIVGFSGCTDPWEEVKKLEAEVMEVHDISMAKMDKIYQTEKALKELRTQIGTEEHHDHPEFAVEIDQALADLDEADAGMFDWMANYKAPKKEDYSVEEALKYLNDEMVKIKEVDAKTDKAISEGEKYIEEHGSK